MITAIKNQIFKLKSTFWTTEKITLAAWIIKKNQSIHIERKKGSMICKQHKLVVPLMEIFLWNRQRTTFLMLDLYSEVLLK